MLPAPITTGEKYLAAILDELKAIRAALATPVVGFEDLPSGRVVQLREPETPGR